MSRCHSFSDLARDLEEVNVNYGYNYIELQLVSHHPLVVLCCTLCKECYLVFRMR